MVRPGSSRVASSSFVGVISFSDPVPRTDAAGGVVFPGHLGGIYQAHNARYLGRARAQRLDLLPDGSVLSRRAQQKIVHGERGWRAAATQLEAYGADAPAADRRAWLAHWMAQLTRPLQHGGNHKYAWSLDRRGRRFLPPARPYPKRAPVASARAVLAL